MEWILEWRSDALTPIFKALTFLGDATFFLVFLPLGYWFWHRRIFGRTTLLLLLGTLLNTWLKAYFQLPRPSVEHLVEAEGWSFPSGHAQLAATVWPWLALELRRRWVWIPAILLVLGISASRVYLGVHYPRDVMAGMAVGAVCVGAVWLGRTWWDRQEQVFGAREFVFLILGPAILCFLTFPAPIDPLTATAGGALVGFAVTLLVLGDVRLDRTLRWRSRERLWMAAVLGLLGAFGLRAGLKPLLAALPVEEALAYFLRYGILGAWLAGLAPLLFVALGLAEGWQGDKIGENLRKEK